MWLSQASAHHSGPAGQVCGSPGGDPASAAPAEAVAVAALGRAECCCGTLGSAYLCVELAPSTHGSMYNIRLTCKLGPVAKEELLLRCI